MNNLSEAARKAPRAFPLTRQGQHCEAVNQRAKRAKNKLSLFRTPQKNTWL